MTLPKDPNRNKVKCICKECGKEFFTTKSKIEHGKKYCSYQCYLQYTRKNLKISKRICKECGRTFFTPTSKIKNDDRGFFCSKECYVKNQNNSKVRCICEECKSEFFMASSRKKQKFCSRKCQKLWTKKFGKKGILSICSQCGEEFFTYPSRKMYGKGKFCSPKCYAEWLSENKSGKNAINWKGGTSFGKYCPKFNKPRKRSVRRIFHHKCIICGIDEYDLGYKLDIHHADHDRQQGCVGKPFNLVPLCKSCHSKEQHKEEEYKKYINKTLEEGFKWGIWSRDQYIAEVMS